MRLKFVSGKQKELINNYKNQKGLTWNQLCRNLNLRQGRLKAYFYETSLIDERTYSRIDRNKDYYKFLLEKREENWGRKKGGFVSKGNIKSIKESEESRQLAEFYGILLGDGNSYKNNYYNSWNDKRGVFLIRIIGDSNLDKKYLLNYVKPLIKDLFNVETRSYFSQNRNFMFVEVNSCRLVDFLESKGFLPGDKIKNKLRIPDWIKNNKEYLKACLRGLYDTDGSVYKLTNQNSYQVCFTNRNSVLLTDVRNSLLSLNIKCSKISKKKDIYITKKSESIKFLKQIGFNNSRHLCKVRRWNLDSPVV